MVDYLLCKLKLLDGFGFSAKDILVEFCLGQNQNGAPNYHNRQKGARFTIKVKTMPHHIFHSENALISTLL